MINSVESNPISLSPRERLKSFLPKLPVSDSHLVKFFLSFDKEFPSDSLLNNVSDLLDKNWEKAEQKRKERRSAKQVDVMDILAPFSAEEKILIAENLGMWQLTDGCTVNCPGCGVRAKKGVKEIFTFDSIRKFLDEYGKYLPKSGLDFYHRSDPFDWISRDGKYGYVDLIDYAVKHVKNSKVFTTTAVPLGSELSIINTLLYFFSKSKDTGKKDGAKPIMRVGNFGEFRFSQTSKNKERIDKIFQILKELGFPKSFSEKMIDVIVREGEENREGAIHSKFKNIGYFINNPSRNEDGRDVLGLAGFDCLTFSPSGVLSEIVEIATQVSPEGLNVTSLVPGRLEIPEIVWLEAYEKVVDKNNNLFKLLPKQQYKIYDREGKLQGVKTTESVRRDALAFCIAIDNLDRIAKVHSSKKAKNHPEWETEMRRELSENFIPQYKERKESCQSLFANEIDRQAINIACKRINEIDIWLDNMDEKLGTTT